MLELAARLLIPRMRHTGDTARHHRHSAPAPRDPAVLGKKNTANVPNLQHSHNGQQAARRSTHSDTFAYPKTPRMLHVVNPDSCLCALTSRESPARPSTNPSTLPRSPHLFLCRGCHPVSRCLPPPESVHRFPMEYDIISAF